MGSTYLELTNRVIRKINEVELTQTNFLSAKGMQAVCKDAIRDSISEINQQEWDWPYHAVQTTQTLLVGESEYAWPSDFKTADWNSFQIVADEVLQVTNTHLQFIDRDEWYTRQRDIDNDNPNGIRVPVYVFKAHGNGFGVSPVADKAYTIEYRYYRQENPLTSYEDTTDIPSVYDNVIVMGALWHMNLFKENQAGVGIAQESFKKGINAMYSILVGVHGDSVRDTRVNFGGNTWNAENGAYHL